jgi:hypothetical protein
VLTDGFCAVDVKLPGPVQAYVTPEVDELPASVTVVAAQVIVPPVADAPGAVLLVVTVAVADELQPLAGFLTVKL